MTAPTPRPHAERAPEGEVTAAVERGAEDLRSLYLTDQTEPVSRYREEAATVLAAALDVEEMAGVLASHAGWRSYGPHGYGLECSCGVDLGEHSMAVNANDVHQRHQAEALRAAILGGAA
jgi:hypothetical protein